MEQKSENSTQLTMEQKLEKLENFIKELDIVKDNEKITIDFNANTKEFSNLYLHDYHDKMPDGSVFSRLEDNTEYLSVKLNFGKYKITVFKNL